MIEQRIAFVTSILLLTGGPAMCFGAVPSKYHMSFHDGKPAIQARIQQYELTLALDTSQNETMLPLRIIHTLRLKAARESIKLYVDNDSYVRARRLTGSFNQNDLLRNAFAVPDRAHPIRDGTDGVLGLRWLSDRPTELDFPAGIVSRGVPYNCGKGSYEQEILTAHGVPAITLLASIGKVRMPVVIDTGYGGELRINEAASHVIFAKAGASHRAIPASVLMSFGKIRLNDVRVSLYEDYSQRPQAMLGMAVAKHMRLLLHLDAGRICLSV